jgi:hypothetical protein
MEQELATTEEHVKVKDYIREREKLLGTPLLIKDWVIFSII